MAEYIEREALLRRFNIDDMMNVNGTLIVLDDARATIKGFPAADVVEVKHGEWKCVGQVCVDGEYEDTFRCSKCSVPYFRKSRYCPNCGCRMDGGNK